MKSIELFIREAKMNAEYNKSGLRNLENHKLLSNSVKIILFYVTLEEKFLLE